MQFVFQFAVSEAEEVFRKQLILHNFTILREGQK